MERVGPRLAAVFPCSGGRLSNWGPVREETRWVAEWIVDPAGFTSSSCHKHLNHLGS
ncbi:hypothetical protein SBV1_2600006 [Verrucomicrobia bacterium]|nr:hypothetical protein SBV1_2600006 [Verrucomicrobiota bacterium]